MMNILNRRGWMLIHNQQCINAMRELNGFRATQSITYYYRSQSCD